MTRLRQTLSLLLLVPAVVPLMYISGVIYPYITPKTLLLQGSGMVALALFAYLALKGESFLYGRLRARTTWIPALLLVVAYTTSFFGVGFYHSFWGSFDRGDGLFTLTIITTFFYLILLSADRAFFERLVKVIAVVAGIVAAIAVLQWIETLFSARVSILPPISGRIGSTLGNAAFLAGYLGMTLFVTLVALRDATGFWRNLYKVSVVLSVLAILFAATRGTILALMCAGSVALIFAAWRGEGSVKRTARYGILLLAILASLFFVFRTELSQSSFEPIKRIASISLSDGTVSSRLFLWSNITTEALERPFSGYGAEHIEQLFDKVYDPTKISEQWFDRSHNTFLDYFAEYGVFGLALYLALIGAFIAAAIRIYRRETPGVMNPGFLFFLLILTYVVQNFFVFDTPVSLWVLYALLASVIAWSAEAPATPLSLPRVPTIVPAVLSLGITLLIVPTIIIPLYANILFTKGYLLHVLDVKQANAYFEKGLSLGTYADIGYGHQAYDMYTAHQAVQLTGQDRMAGYQFALSTLTANFAKYPYDARTAVYLAHVLDTAPPEASVDANFLREVIARALTVSPRRAQVWYILANLSIGSAKDMPIGPEKTARYKEAIGILKGYVSLVPSLSEPHYVLADLYFATGDVTQAKTEADIGDTYYSGDLETARRAALFYERTEDWEHAMIYLQRVVDQDKNSISFYYDLAKVKYMTGDEAGALRIVNDLRVSNPEILPTDQNFLTAITAYESKK